MFILRFAVMNGCVRNCRADKYLQQPSSAHVCKYLRRTRNNARHAG